MIPTIGKTNFSLALESLNKNFMKKIFLLILLLTSSLIYAQNSIGVLKTDANIRWEASTNSGVIKVLPKGTTVEIENRKRKWSFIKNPDDGKKGWVSNSLLLDAAILKTDANIRWEASTNSGVIKVLPKGTTVEIENRKRKWSFIKNPDDGKKGWVSNSLLSNNLIYDSTKQPKITQPKIVLKNVVPNCDYKITSPLNGSNNVSTNLTIKLKHGTGNPEGYYFTIASNIDGKLDYVKTKNGKLIRRLNIGFVDSYNIPNLKPYTTYSIGILPYNDIGLAYDCDQPFSFKTGSEITGFSVNQIIENRLKNMPNPNTVLSRWNTFKSTKLDRIVMNKTQTNLFLQEVKTWNGVPFKLSGTTRNGVDCSGLIWRGLRQAIDYNGQRLNAQMWGQSGKLIANKSDLQPGDLVCFTNTRSVSKLVHHIAIYLGNNKFWHAPSTGSVVSEESLDNVYWKPRFIFGVRFSK